MMGKVTVFLTVLTAAYLLAHVSSNEPSNVEVSINETPFVELDGGETECYSDITKGQSWY